MSMLGDQVYDYGLIVLNTEANRLDICNAEPSSYANAVGLNSLGNKLSPTISTPSDRAGGGRKVTVSAISDGEVTATDQATHYAITDTVNQRLLAAAPLATPQSVTDGNTFTLTAFDVGIPDPA